MPLQTTGLLNDWTPDVGQFTDAVGGAHLVYEAAAAAPTLNAPEVLATFAGAQGAITAAPLAVAPGGNSHMMVCRVENETGSFYTAFAHAVDKVIFFGLVPKTPLGSVDTTLFVIVARGSGINVSTPWMAAPRLFTLAVVDDFAAEMIHIYVDGLRRGSLYLTGLVVNNGVAALAYAGRAANGGSRMVGSVGRILRYTGVLTDGAVQGNHEALRLVYPGLPAQLNILSPLYNVTGISILGGKYNALTAAKKLEEQVTAEMLLRLKEPVYTGTAGEQVALAIAHQLNFQLELGINALTLRTLASGHAGQQTEYRDRVVSPIAHALIRQVTRAVSVGFEVPPG